MPSVIINNLFKIHNLIKHYKNEEHFIKQNNDTVSDELVNKNRLLFERCKIIQIKCKYQVINHLSKTNNFLTLNEGNGWDVYWTDRIYLTMRQMKELMPYQRINYFPGINVLTNKQLLAERLNLYKQLFPNEYNFFPNTWIIPKIDSEAVNLNNTSEQNQLNLEFAEDLNDTLNQSKVQSTETINIQCVTNPKSRSSMDGADTDNFLKTKIHENYNLEINGDNGEINKNIIDTIIENLKLKTKKTINNNKESNTEMNNNQNIPKIANKKIINKSTNIFDENSVRSTKRNTTLSSIQSETTNDVETSVLNLNNDFRRTIARTKISEKDSVYSNKENITLRSFEEYKCNTDYSNNTDNAKMNTKKLSGMNTKKYYETIKTKRKIAEKINNVNTTVKKPNSSGKTQSGINKLCDNIKVVHNNAAVYNNRSSGNENENNIGLKKTTDKNLKNILSLHNNVNSRISFFEAKTVGKNVVPNYKKKTQLQCSAAFEKKVEESKLEKEHKKEDVKKVVSAKEVPTQTQLCPVYILKPSDGCQGNGILLSLNVNIKNKESPNDISKENKNNDSCNHSNNKTDNDTMICQQYITNPLLWDGYKFDVRFYVLITSIKDLRVYVYKEGIVRFATEKYEFPNKDNLNHKFMHLTNYSINKTSENYDEEYCKRNLKQFQNYLSNKNIDINKLYSRINKIIIKTILCGYKSILTQYNNIFKNYVYREACFQLLGFDIILDETFNPMLLEVNKNPSLKRVTEVDKEVKSKLVNDMFNLLNLNENRMRGDILRDNLNSNTCTKQIQHELNNIGDFKLIYPDIKNENFYEKFIVD